MIVFWFHQIHVLHDEPILDKFNIDHTAIVDQLALLSFMPRTFSQRIADQKQEKGKRMSMDVKSVSSQT